MAKSTGKYYYIRYAPKAKHIDYVFLFSLQEIAEYDTKTKTFSIVKYKTIKQLAESVSISTATLNRILSFRGNYAEYKDFITIDRINKVITLLNDFKDHRHTPFVVIPKDVLKLLRKKNDSFLIKYYLYLKKNYNYAKSIGKSGIDNTAQQFLMDCGYCSTSGNYKTKVSVCNAFLVAKKIIKIDSNYTDNLHLRNWYQVIDDYKENSFEYPTAYKPMP